MPLNTADRPARLIELLAAETGIVCFAGAGGKKSTMYRLASQASGRVALTATVHTPPFRKHSAERTVIAPEEELAAQVAAAGDCRVVAYAHPSDKKARLAGVKPQLVENVHDTCGFDVTLVKADGARLRRIKAPGEHEPALPRRIATLIYVVSVRAVGEPLDEAVAHRPELIAELTGAAPGRPISTEHVARLLAHPRGGLKNAESAGRVVPVINMVDSDEQKYTARLIAEQALELAPGLDYVVLTRMVSEQPVVDVIMRRIAGP